MTRLLVNARDLRCPLPLLKLKQQLAQADIGDVIDVEATDVGSWRDIPAFIELTKHLLLDQRTEPGVYYFTVQKGE